LYRMSGRRYPVRLETELAGDLNGMFRILDRYLYSQSRDESWLVFLPTRKLVEKYADSYRGVYIHGGLEGSEINKIQRRAEQDKNLRIFATNVIASSVNIYVDNVLIFDDVIDSKDKLGQKTLHYTSIDNNSLLQMMGRVGRFKPGRAVVLTDAPLPKKIDPIPVRKALETETPFDLVLLMSKYGLKLSELEFMSKVDHLKGWAEDSNGSFVSKMVVNGLFPGYVEEAWKNYEAAREALNDLLGTSRKKPIPKEVVVDADATRLRPYLENCLSFERFGPHERKGHEFKEMSIEGPFYARALTINYRRILFDIVALNSPSKRRHQTKR